MRLRRSVAGIASLLMVASLGGVSAPAAADDPPPEEVVVATDFEDGSWAPWVQSGSPTLSVVDTEGGKALSVADRVNDYDGIQTPEGLLTEGHDYTFTMRVRLAEGTDGSAAVRWVMKPAYAWGGSTTMTADAWTTVTATYTAPAEGQVYIGTDPVAGLSSYTYLVDEIVVTTTGDAGGGSGDPGDVRTIWSLDFDDDSYTPWNHNGGTLEFVDADDGRALRITRTRDWEGIKSPAGVLEHGVEYTFSMRARLPEGTEGTREVRFVVEPRFTWIGNTTIDGDGWTEVTGSYTLPDDVDPATAAIYLGSSPDEETFTFLVDDLVVTGVGGGGSGEHVDLTFDFEDGTLQGWVPRTGGATAPTVEVTDVEAHTGTYAAIVTDRDDQGDGIAYEFTDIFETGVAYDVTAWVKMAEGEASDDIWLSLQSDTSSFSTLGQFTGVTSGAWREVSASFTMPSGTMALLYFETRWPDGGAGDFLVDDIRVRSQAPPDIEDLASIWEVHDDHFPVGVAIDERETFGAPAQLTTLHFNQVTAENHMKPDAWYDGERNFRIHDQARAIMDFAQANDLGVYGHVLVWHSQVPGWFFEDDTGAPLGTSEEDQQILRVRMREHIHGVAEALSEWGEYGGDNPLVAWDVVNEVVSDSGEHADGLRRSEWYRILDEEFIDLAFEYADEAFNDVYAAEGSERPVTLFINDYNTELGGKQNRYLALIERLIDRGVPIDGVGHQFHVSLSMPISALEAAIERFQPLGLPQVITELDVTVGTPVTEANLIEQGYYYRDAFRLFRDHAEDLYSVTVWGLTDNRSWRSAQAPLIFDANLRAKPAYYGVVDADIEPRIRTAIVFRGEPAVDEEVGSVEWQKLPLHRIEDLAAFQLRWSPTALTAYVEVADATADAGDGVTFRYGDEDATVHRDGTSGLSEVLVEEVDGGYVVAARLPVDGLTEGGTLEFDVEVTDGDVTASWGADGASGTLTLVEELSFVEIPEAPSAPVIDGEVDAVWDLANVVTTDTIIQGDASAATAQVRTLWRDDTLFVLAEVTDDAIDVSGSDPWVQDSVEIFVDAGNARNGPYRFDDTQIRINVDNEVSVGTGDEAFQLARVDSATSIAEGGYVVEAAISLLEHGGQGTFHGLDFQVNDGTDGTRTGIRTWADPTGLGYQSTVRWGVGQLVATGGDPGGEEPGGRPPFAGRPGDRPGEPPVDLPVGPPTGRPGGPDVDPPGRSRRG